MDNYQNKNDIFISSRVLNYTGTKVIKTNATYTGSSDLILDTLDVKWYKKNISRDWDLIAEVKVSVYDNPIKCKSHLVLEQTNFSSIDLTSSIQFKAQLREYWNYATINNDTKTFGNITRGLCKALLYKSLTNTQASPERVGLATQEDIGSQNILVVASTMTYNDKEMRGLVQYYKRLGFKEVFPEYYEVGISNCEVPMYCMIKDLISTLKSQITKEQFKLLE